LGVACKIPLDLRWFARRGAALRRLHEIQKLQRELKAFNERIVELENVGHRGHAMEVLKANAIDFARQIDELRCLLVASAPKDAKGAS
jgi:hypothetical protein